MSHELALAAWAIGAEAHAGTCSADDDESIVRTLTRTWDEDLFSILVRRHRDRVHRVAAAVLGPGRESEAEDVAQEVFVLAFRKLAGFRGECAFSTWLLRLTRNLAVDRLRLARLRRPHLPEEVLERLSDPTPAGDPEARILAHQQRRRLLEHLEELPDPHRTALYLYYWLGLSVAEIAGSLELNPETVKSHLHRGRRRLARALSRGSR